MKERKQEEETAGRIENFTDDIYSLCVTRERDSDTV
jgi:hypothetical protein